MRNRILLFTFSAVLFGCSCKQQKKATETQVSIAAKPIESVQTIQQPAALSDTVTVAYDQEADGDATSYRLIVSFISIGEGVDGAAGEKLLEIIKQHESAFGMPLRYDRFQRGREGEYIMCFKLLNEDEKSKNNFIDRVKEALGKNQLVIITENGTYKK